MHCCTFNNLSKRHWSISIHVSHKSVSKPFFTLASFDMPREFEQNIRLVLYVRSVDEWRISFSKWTIWIAIYYVVFSMFYLLLRSIEINDCQSYSMVVFALKDIEEVIMKCKSEELLLELNHTGSQNRGFPCTKYFPFRKSK